jgi:putative hydrolase of the HAD superfamily
MPIKLICLDADDTLWHNMRHFDDAERALYALLQPFVELGIAQQQLEAVEARNLKLYGYGAKSFTLSMIETAIELGGDKLPMHAVADILSAGRRLLAHPVELLPGVMETLDALSSRGKLVLVTKGDLLHQEGKLAASGLGKCFAAIEIVSDKTPDTFRRLCAQHSVEPAQVVMAGDSLRSDVVPALDAGAWAALVPYELTWSHERGDAPVNNMRFCRLETLSDLPAWIDSIG